MVVKDRPEVFVNVCRPEDGSKGYYLFASNWTLPDHPELYTFVDISQNSHTPGEPNWDHAQWVRQYLAPAPRRAWSTRSCLESAWCAVRNRNRARAR